MGASAIKQRSDGPSQGNCHTRVMRHLALQPRRSAAAAARVAGRDDASRRRSCRRRRSRRPTRPDLLTLQRPRGHASRTTQREQIALARGEIVRIVGEEQVIERASAVRAASPTFDVHRQQECRRTHLRRENLSPGSATIERWAGGCISPGGRSAGCCCGLPGGCRRRRASERRWRWSCRPATRRTPSHTSSDRSCRNSGPPTSSSSSTTSRPTTRLRSRGRRRDRDPGTRPAAGVGRQAARLLGRRRRHELLRPRLHRRRRAARTAPARPHRRRHRSRSRGDRLGAAVARRRAARRAGGRARQRRDAHGQRRLHDSPAARPDRHRLRTGAGRRQGNLRPGRRPRAPDVRASLTEDIALARRVGRSRLYSHRRDATLRMYPRGLAQSIAGWSRTMAAGMAATRWWLTLAVAAWVSSLAGGPFAGWPAYPLSAAQVWVLGRRAGRFGPRGRRVLPACRRRARC